MSVTPAEWVAPHVKEFFTIDEASNLPCPEAERDCARRLVLDHRMMEVYKSKYLIDRLNKDGWRAWFDLAKSILPADLKERREKLKKHVDLVHELASHLEAAVRVKAAIDDLQAAENKMPRELHNTFALVDAAVECASGHGSSDLRSLFYTHIKPGFDKLRTFRVGRYFPTVGHMLCALSGLVVDYSELLRAEGASSNDPAMRAALSSRQSAPVAEYVRYFDEEMSMRIAGSSDSGIFRLPPAIMAIQVEVALNLHSVDKKQIISARKPLG